MLAVIPTVAEAGYPSAESDFWVGLSAPAKTPSFIFNKLHDTTEELLQTPAVKEKLAKLEVDPQLMSVAQFKRFFRDDCKPQRSSPNMQVFTRWINPNTILERDRRTFPKRGRSSSWGDEDWL